MWGRRKTKPCLIIGRFLQGAGGALSASVIVAIIVTEFPGRAERARAMSAYIFVAVGGGSIGLLVGGIITQALNWHWIFFINVPVGVFTFIFGRALIDENVGLGLRDGVDVTGSVLVTAALMVAVYTIVTTTQNGWGSLHTLGFGALAIALLGSFLVLEAKLRNPIMPLRILRIRSLTTSSIVRGFLATGNVLDVLSWRSVLREGAGLLACRDRYGLLASVTVHGLDVGRNHRTTGRSVRCEDECWYRPRWPPPPGSSSWPEPEPTHRS